MDVIRLDIDKAKADQLAAVNFPIDGLTFGENEVLYHGLPLKDNASQEEQVRISAAIELQRNPGLRLLIVRQGALFDEEHLTMLLDMAKEAGVSDVWVERVGTGPECSLIIEDGKVLSEPTEGSANK